jgi:SAM-dependent methyltransferase
LIHPAAAKGFARSVDAYERGRPGYPPEALALLGLRPGMAVLDLAAGSGKLTRPLLEAGAEVTAVEPVTAMRAALPEAARVLDGTAEVIPLDDGSVDLVTVGQAFHWFDGDAALAEIHRVLRPGGRLALLWNRRLDDDPVNRAIDALLDPHRGDVPGMRRDAWRAAFERTALFGPLEEHELPNEQRLDADGLADRLGSVSFIASLPGDERAQVLAGARAIAADGPVSVLYLAQVQLCRRIG